jgi:endonuclease/exonuclease/phosphatase family metal-dependent hydrolase
VVRLNPGSLRRSIRIGRRQERLDWLVNRRVCQLVPVRIREVAAHAANLHATKHADLAKAELERLATLLPEGPLVVTGDFNVRGMGLPGFSAPIPGIDQILVRGFELVARPVAWDDERRRYGSGLLSDHAPVEAVIEAPVEGVPRRRGD